MKKLLFVAALTLASSFSQAEVLKMNPYAKYRQVHHEKIQREFSEDNTEVKLEIKDFKCIAVVNDLPEDLSLIDGASNTELNSIKDNGASFSLTYVVPGNKDYSRSFELSKSVCK